MLTMEGNRDEHEKFKRLCALAVSEGLAPLEVSELRSHLRDCEECRELLPQYRSLTTQGIFALADAYLENSELTSWDDLPARRRLLANVSDEQKAVPLESSSSVVLRHGFLSKIAASSAVRIAVAASLLFAIAFGSYRLGLREQSHNTPDVRAAYIENRLEKLSQEKRGADETLTAQAAKLAQLQLETAGKERELEKLRSELQEVEAHSSGLLAASGQSEAQSRALLQQRDTLNAQLQVMIQSYETQKAELASMRSESDKTVFYTSTLEAKIAALTASNRDQDRQLKDAQQYLTSDKDIRELMGARKLYIADVFDVDGTSRTQKPFGRVFYTQGKSLIFYAFDLDREPGVVNASTFQVWGQRDTPQGEQAAPMNLGILYRDSESNRRWVMRFDEHKQLSEIDAVFVTVEPRGGSHKPTSKPFLYALLRNQANHP